MKLHENHNELTTARATRQGPAGGRSRLHHFLVAAALLTSSLVSRGLGQDKTAGEDRPHRYQHPGARDLLPVFRESAAGRLSFPYSWPAWSKRNGHDFDRWRREARARVPSRFLAAPLASGVCHWHLASACKGVARPSQRNNCRRKAAGDLPRHHQRSE
ncbi:MAG: hypothetical protein HQ567_26370 [Candidatus Nealsonbacteria bacterium]|nr:hypothetical protein [Candidatus Nealsonbacteria bacterium]